MQIIEIPSSMKTEALAIVQFYWLWAVSMWLFQHWIGWMIDWWDWQDAGDKYANEMNKYTHCSFAKMVWHFHEATTQKRVNVCMFLKRNRCNNSAIEMILSGIAISKMIELKVLCARFHQYPLHIWMITLSENCIFSFFFSISLSYSSK